MALNREQLSELREGMELPELKKTVTREKIKRYAEASRDFNPIHLDQEFARQAGLDGTIAHGMLILAYLSEMMTNAFQKTWLTGGKLNVRFRTPARPGDTIRVSGRIRRVEKNEGETTIICEVLCANQADEAVITGEARITVRTD